MMRSWYGLISLIISKTMVLLSNQWAATCFSETVVWHGGDQYENHGFDKRSQYQGMTFICQLLNNEKISDSRFPHYFSLTIFPFQAIYIYWIKTGCLDNLTKSEESGYYVNEESFCNTSWMVKNCKRFLVIKDSVEPGWDDRGLRERSIRTHECLIIQRFRGFPQALPMIFSWGKSPEVIRPFPKEKVPKFTNFLIFFVGTWPLSIFNGEEGTRTPTPCGTWS